MVVVCDRVGWGALGFRSGSVCRFASSTCWGLKRAGCHTRGHAVCADASTTTAGPIDPRGPQRRRRDSRGRAWVDGGCGAGRRWLVDESQCVDRREKEGERRKEAPTRHKRRRAYGTSGSVDAKASRPRILTTRHHDACVRVRARVVLGARTRDAALVGALGRSIGHGRGRGLDRVGHDRSATVCAPLAPRTIAPMMHAAHTQAAAASIIVWPGSFNSFTPGPQPHARVKPNTKAQKNKKGTTTRPTMARRQWRQQEHEQQQDGPAPPTRPAVWLLLGAAAVVALQLATGVEAAAATATTTRGAWGHRRAAAGEVGFVPSTAEFWGSRDGIGASSALDVWAGCR